LSHSAPSRNARTRARADGAAYEGGEGVEGGDPAAAAARRAWCAAGSPHTNGPGRGCRRRRRGASRAAARGVADQAGAPAH
jgi:hypothetical protein